jgi:hypothetical protein
MRSTSASSAAVSFHDAARLFERHLIGNFGAGNDAADLGSGGEPGECELQQGVTVRFRKSNQGFRALQARWREELGQGRGSIPHCNAPEIALAAVLPGRSTGSC